MFRELSVANELIHLPSDDDSTRIWARTHSSSLEPEVGRFVTLDDLMRYIPFHVFYELSGAFAESETECRAALRASGSSAGKVPIPQDLRAQCQRVFETAKASPEFAEILPFAVGTIDRLVNALGSPQATLWELGELFRDLHRRIADELRNQIHFQVYHGCRGLVVKPLHGWDNAIAKFPDIRSDVTEAGFCLAFDRWTAVVFHLMRVLENGLRGFAAEVGVDGSLDYENWKNIIDRIEKKIREVEQEPKSPAKAEKAQRYAELASQFRYFKDAWRNHVSHSRAAYDSHQAKSVYEHVRDFMQKMVEIE